LLRNDIGKEGAKAILEVAEGKPQLTTICGIKPEETERDFSRKNLKAGDAMLLAFDLRKNSALVKLK
jgi:type IV secretory pathway ATPase VirB11/archaellum biosynthesis ATPase